MRSIHGGSEFMPWSEACAALGGLAEQDVTTWSDQQVHDGLRALLPAVNQLAAVVSMLVGSFDTRNLSEDDGFRATRTWLSAFGRMSQGAASSWLSHARLLRQLPALASRAAAGTVSTEHLRKVADLVDQIGPAAVAPFDEILADLAAHTKPVDVAQACERIRAHVDPDGADPDPDANERRSLSIARVGSLYSVKGQLDPEGGAIVLTALDALTRPPTPDDPRTATQRRADALIELARQALNAGTLPTVGGYRPHLGLLLTPEALGADPHHPEPTSPESTVDKIAHVTGDSTGEATGAVTGGVKPARRPPKDALELAGVPPLPEAPQASWRTQLPTAVAQRIACDCEVFRVILDPTNGLPLDVGRTYRLVPAWMRKALQARDQGCRWPGCDAPHQWTDAHHLIPWYQHGVTRVEDLALLCRYHHCRVHEGRWKLRLDRTTGEIHITRPDGTPYELGPSQPFRPPHEKQPPTTELPRAA